MMYDNFYELRDSLGWHEFNNTGDVPRSVELEFCYDFMDVLDGVEEPRTNLFLYDGDVYNWMASTEYNYWRVKA